MTLGIALGFAAAALTFTTFMMKSMLPLRVAALASNVFFVAYGYVESLPHVVNYDLPHVSEDYVHRIGRTGRAGETGQAVSLVSGEDRSYLRDIERLIGKQIEQQVIPGFEVGSGYHSAKPEPQGRRGQGRQSQPRSSGGKRSCQRNQGNGQRNQGNGQRPRSFPSSHEEGWRAAPGRSGRGRQHSEQGRSGRPQRQAAPAMPQEKVQQSVRQEQLEYHRQHKEADEHRSEAAPTGERGKEKAVPALFGLVGRKVA